MLLIAIAAFLAGLALGLGYAKIRCDELRDDLKRADWNIDFWREHCDNWHQLAVAAGAAQRKPVLAKAGKAQRITVPDPPQAEIVAAGRTGIHVWRN